ncbi:MAG: di-trans,poly-cis-decaprenylcistransferase [Clostridiales bacterium GWF2_38_85]|nr:MAG: di-trans,poly-cis-decaprenylcistransferase [Clostridiales bacterium GWF2_38_85]HBL84888.1 di-trans,poly-cis-decaprenylcistransferase [Clostridiales bacterium]
MFKRKKITAISELNNNLIVPKHIAIIMDGNGRWAKQRGLPRTAGHAAGGESFINTVDACNSLRVKYLTVFAFSTENWKRSEDEIKTLVELMHKYIANYVPKLMELNISLRLLGDYKAFDAVTVTSLEKSIDTLRNNTGMTLCIALNYGGKADICYAVNNLIQSGKRVITEKDITENLYTVGIPDPELVIRTSGEERLSNFLLWQTAYSELYFSTVYWPDFDKKELLTAIESYSKRNRRFGGA